MVRNYSVQIVYELPTTWDWVCVPGPLRMRESRVA